MTKDDGESKNKKPVLPDPDITIKAKLRESLTEKNEK
jgi:hypothetical protein